MIDAKEARIQSDLRKKMAELEKIRIARIEYEKQQEYVDSYVEDELPLRLDFIENKIKDACEKGIRSVTIDFGNSRAEFCLLEAVITELRSLHYITETKYYSERVNHGNSAAPCVVNEDGYILTVKW